MDSELKAHVGYLLESAQELKLWAERMTVALEAGAGETQKQCELEALITEREGMVAENQFCHYLGQAPAYVEDSFMIIAERMRALIPKKQEPPQAGEDGKG